MHYMNSGQQVKAIAHFFGCLHLTKKNRRKKTWRFMMIITSDLISSHEFCSYIFHVCAIPTTVMSSSPSNFLKRVFSLACFFQQWQVIHCTLTSTFFPLFKSDYLHVNNETKSLPKIRTTFRFQGQTSSGVNQSNIDTQSVINNAANVSGDSPGC
jgi:hypothetical protein